MSSFSVLDFALADFVFAPLLLEHLAQVADIVAGYFAHDLALLGVFDRGDGFVGRFAQHLARFQPAARAGDHLVAANKRIAASRRKHAEVAHHSMADDVTGHKRKREGGGWKGESKSATLSIAVRFRFL